MSFASIVEPLRVANLLARQPQFEINCHSLSGESALSSFGAKITTTPINSMDLNCDLALIVAGGDPFSIESSALYSWCRSLDRRNIRIGGISGGPVILAKAGLMNGRRMTVHWEHAPVLQELYPDLILIPSLFVVDRNRVTCAGGTAPMDFAHILIAECCGVKFARLVSDWFMHTDIRASDNPQRAGLLERYGTRSRPVLETIETMSVHIADPLTLLQLANRAEVSKRQLCRLFGSELGQSPMTFYRNLRLDIAADLIQTTPLSFTEIAIATGFSDSAHFSKSWKARWGLSPKQTVEHNRE